MIEEEVIFLVANADNGMWMAQPQLDIYKILGKVTVLPTVMDRHYV